MKNVKADTSTKVEASLLLDEPYHNLIGNRLTLKSIAPIGLLVGLLMVHTNAIGATEFTSKDWQVVCDNTRTCRLAGYQAENNSDFPVSILLTRRAGAEAPVEGKVKIGGAKESSAKALMQLGNRHRISMYIDDKSLGETQPFSIAAGDAELTANQVSALLDALTKSSKIELVLRSSRWQLSDRGASAVMLKADEVQGRSGTPSALINKGSASTNSRVLPPKPAPTLRWVAPSSKVTADSNENFTIRPSQLAAMVKRTMPDARGVCPNLSDDTSWRLIRVSGTQLLAQHNCWTGAYNTGMGAWLINDNKPYKPTLITTDATSYDKGKISAVQKGRGLGDCLTKTDWIWTGSNFEKSHESTTGLCRMIEPGGAWQLPTYVTEVKMGK